MNTITLSTGRELITRCEEKALNGEAVTPEEALELLELPSDLIMPLMAAADSVRRYYKGNAISLCSIVNARSGRCSEDCAFCSQSVFSSSDIQDYDLMDNDKIIAAGKDAVNNGAHKFGIVTSGKGAETKRGDIEKICDSISSMKSSLDVHRCASLGVIDEQQARALKEAGLQEFHHNLETARSFYPNVCTTRSYDENISSIRAAKSAGLRVCGGGIFGMGEDNRQRVEMAEELRNLDVDSIPLNFLVPIEGTKLENAKPLSPLEILKIIAVYRLYLPDKDIKVAGGREKNLRDLQSFIFFAGANSTMVGNYLTTKGREASADLKMIEDMEMDVVD